jgi:hypothetical protein
MNHYWCGFPKKARWDAKKGLGSIIARDIEKSWPYEIAIFRIVGPSQGY